jgi:hypothetical protein
MTKKPRTWKRWAIVHKNGGLEPELFFYRTYARSSNQYAGKITRVVVTEAKPKKRRTSR